MSCSASPQQAFFAEVWKVNKQGAAWPFPSHTAILSVEASQTDTGDELARGKDIDGPITFKKLSLIPREKVYPLVPSVCDRVPEIYVRTPDLSLYKPGAEDTIARDFAHEVIMYDEIRRKPHPNLVQSFGFILGNDDLVTGIAVAKYKTPLIARVDDPISFTLEQRSNCIADIQAALNHLHKNQLAHNDVCPKNIMFTDKGEAVLVNLRTCAFQGDPITEGGRLGEWWNGTPMRVYEESSAECDDKALELLSAWLKGKFDMARALSDVRFESMRLSR
ncbi:hypothetical protein FDECE_13074 [Fusarium decemcellulare]|nr:hypothetical protein FDECE_13074 [Fusarium decemcellulare]